MPRHQFDSEYIFGIHESGGESLMIEAGHPGWIIFTEAIGSDANDKSGKDYRPWSDRGLGVLVRLNNGYHPGGTIPNEAQYSSFAQRCANFVANSPGCKIWIIGNEMNYAIERPPRVSSASFEEPVAPTGPTTPVAPTSPTPKPSGSGLWDWFSGLIKPSSENAPRVQPAPNDPYYHGDPSRFSAINEPETNATRPLPPGIDASDASAPLLSLGEGEPVTPELYARCYTACRTKIQMQAGHGTDRVVIGAVAPWNAQTRYPGNESGDWVRYFRDILAILGPEGCDGMTLHTYTHGQDANLINSEVKMGDPFQNRYYEFRAYQDFMRAVPPNMRHLPVYITETDEDAEWLDQNIAWVQRAYGEINWWNRQTGNQQIQSLCLYRWPKIDKWYIEGKNGVIQDFKDALKEDYRWKRVSMPAISVAQGEFLRTRDWMNLRETPNGRILGQVSARALAKVLTAAPTLKDDIYWWNVEVALKDATSAQGWLAQESSQGLPLLERAPADVVPPVTPTEPTPTPDAIKVGGFVKTLDLVRMRQTPGVVGKPEGDILYDVPADTVLTVIDGPQTVDTLAWWKARGNVAEVGELTGWMAELAPNGIRLLSATSSATTPSPTEPDTETPDPTGTFRVGDKIMTANYVRFRKAPGISSKPDDDVIAELPPGVQGTIKSGPKSADGMIWWQCELPVNAVNQTGWCAEVAGNGVVLLSRVQSAPAVSTTESLENGDLGVTRTAINVRRSPGMTDKPADDLLGYFDTRATLNLIEGPRVAEAIPWWRVGGITPKGEVVGWVAEKLADGNVLVSFADRLPGSDVPSKSAKKYLHAPFEGHFGISQLWGENPATYARFTYDGVPLKGHNGIDFLTPEGTPLVAVDGGIVESAVHDDPGGFGNYVKLKHSWGESLYAHMSQIDVKEGDAVQPGSRLGLSGNTGFSGGPHLHFAIRVNPYLRTDGWGGFIDPLPYLDKKDYTLPTYVQAPATTDINAAPAAPAPHNYAPGYGPEVPGSPRP